MRKKVCGSNHCNGPPIYQVQVHPVHKNYYPDTSSKKNKLSYSCKRCNKSFLHPRHLERHTQGHTRNDCQECTEMCTSRKQLVTHMREKHGKILSDPKYNCKYCEKCFTRSGSLYAHLRVHANGRSVCDICGEFCTNKKELESHKLDKHEDSRLSCLICLQTFSRSQQYARHMQNHDLYQCLTCNLGFSARKILLQHKQQGHKVRLPAPKYQCSECNKFFQTKTLLRKHSKKHLGVKNNTTMCDPPSEALSLPSSSGSHSSQEYKTAADQGFVCEICGKHYLHQLSLNMHRSRNHISKKTYYCDFCSHSTHFKANLTRHIRLHLNERRFVCEQCGAAFFVLSALHDHCLYIHSDLRQHQCDKCPKSFKRSSELKRHIRSHSDVRPHACNLCERSFKRTSHLKRHTETFHNMTQTKSRQVKKLKQGETAVFLPTVKKTKKTTKKTAQTYKDVSNELLMLPYGELVSFKHISDDGTCKDISSVNLDCGQDLSNAPTSHYLVSLPSQSIPTNDPNLVYMTSTSLHHTVCSENQTEPYISKSLHTSNEALDLLKPRHYCNSSELNSHLLLARHEAAMRNVLGADVKLSDSMMEDIVDPRQTSPQQDSPLCMADLVRLQDSGLHDYRSHDLPRDHMTSPMSTDLTADHLAALNADCTSQTSNQFIMH